MVDVPLLCRGHGATHVTLAVRGALACGAHNGRAVGRSRAAPSTPAPRPLDGLPALLQAIKRPAPTLEHYGRLLAQGARR